MSQSPERPSLSISYYEILQVAETAGDLEIKVAYHRLAKRFHPDINPDEKRLAELRFRLITEAYTNLKTPQRRRHYNRILKEQDLAKRSPLKTVARNDNRQNITKADHHKNWWIGFLMPFWHRNKKA